MNRWLLWFSLIAVAAAAFWAWTQFGPPDSTKMYVFKGVRGPSERSLMPIVRQAQIADFANDDPHRLAVLVTNPASGWLGLARGFKARGIPFSMTQDPAAAYRHQVVLVYPIISGAMGAEALRGLAEHVRSGGTVLGFNLAGGGLEELFGTGDGIESRTRDLVRWSQAQGVAREDVISVSHSGESNMGTVGYPNPKADVLATYDDGAAAVTCRTVVGRACLMGVDLGALAERGMNGRGEAIGRDYVNAYEPSVDVLFRWVRQLYVDGEPMPWLLATAPSGKDLSIILTHDVDYTRSVINSQAYAELLRSHGLHGTFFIQTKYVKDWNDDIFFNDKTVPMLRRLKDEGMELGSHTVAHSRAFKAFAMGDGAEAYPRYRPFVIDQTHARDGTVLGELRVPKFLLERETGAEVVSFRPGHLSYPPGLPQALVATGYTYSSSLPADSALSHLPFQTTFDRADAALVPAYEFPVTIEDEQPPRLADRFDQAQEVLSDIARDHGTAVIMIHPDVIEPKLGFERRLIERWQGRAWMGDLHDFGDWWAGRDSLDVDVAQVGGKWVMTARAGRAVRDLDVLFPKAQPRAVRLRLAAGQQTAFTLQ